MNKPYTYLIGWSELNLWYYGSRYARGCDPSDLWVKYFTSSERVKRLRCKVGEPDVIEVRRTFSNGKAARAWEYNVIKRMGAVRKSHWLNLANGGAYNPIGVPRSAETKEKLRIAHTGKKNPHTEEWSAKVSAAKMGHAVTTETRAKLRAANVGKKQPPEAIAKMVAKTIGTKRSDETKEKMRLAWEHRKTHRPPTQESRAKLASNLSGWKEKYTTEQLAEMYTDRAAKVKATWAAKRQP